MSDVLFQSLRVGNLELKNRLILGPMAVLQPQKDGRPSAQTIAFLEARARGGVGMIIVGGAIGTRRGHDEAPFHPLLRMDIEEYLPELREVAEVVKTHGVPIIAEVMTGFGRMGVARNGEDIISASPLNVVIPENQFPQGIIVPGGRTTPTPREATIAEIKALESETIESCLRMQRAGWDGVEIPAHLSYFAASFSSPRTNWRKDEYGGSVENRARFLVNIVSAVRQRAGTDFVIGLRITATERVEGGQDASGYAELAKLVEAAGLDYVALSDGCYETMSVSTPAVDGGLIDSGAAKIFRELLRVPLLLQGLHEPQNSRSAIEEDCGDAVMLARPLLADPNYVNKLKQGKAEEIIRCDRQNYCLRRLAFNMPVRCFANPETGREARMGKSAPLSRLLPAMFEQVVLGVTGSKIFMGLIRLLLKLKPE
ncbi:NADH:flavin oxidoreductase [Pseudomaricurvus alcaniphilus]|uniref:NADH:flavin oxidoreductase n=1 Tax=Pseudomaricurvus alcaniphilus TaxID=1166482 RepID=UPI001408EDF0|nr:NADH:flavin oxidoreductase [Pseudomaricurvus alcaniphilus]NHN39970.1 NADH:flavin oxidoreductase [Pseudomaricurvus alcaniphilus]